MNLDQKSPILRSAFVGDSGYLIIRKVNDQWHIVFESEPQLFQPNVSEQLTYQELLDGKTPTVIENSHNIQHNDIVIVASDGLFDNMHHKTILEIIAEDLDADDKLFCPEKTAEKLVTTARKLSLDLQYESLFALRKKSGYRGGKPDDITVVIGQIVINHA